MTAVSLKTQLSPHDYYLSGTSEYMALFAAVRKLVHDDVVMVRRVWLKAEPFVCRRVLHIRTHIVGLHVNLKVAFEETPLAKQALLAWNQSNSVLKWSSDRARRHLNHVSMLAEREVGQFVMACERVRVEMQPHFQEVAIRATGAFRRAEDAVKHHGREIVTKLGTSKAGYRLRRMLSPVTLKFLEVSVDLLMDASLNKYYG